MLRRLISVSCVAAGDSGSRGFRNIPMSAYCGRIKNLPRAAGSSRWDSPMAQPADDVAPEDDLSGTEPEKNSSKLAPCANTLILVAQEQETVRSRWCEDGGAAASKMPRPVGFAYRDGWASSPFRGLVLLSPDFRQAQARQSRQWARTCVRPRLVGAACLAGSPALRRSLQACRAR